jgi:DHA2 family multidrug resistance protein
MLSRRAQFHQSRLVEHLSPFDPSYQIARDRIGEMLIQKGQPAASSDGLLYRELIRQSTTLAFTDAFLIICLLILCMLPLVLLMQRAPAAAGGPPPDVH